MALTQPLSMAVEGTPVKPTVLIRQADLKDLKGPRQMNTALIRTELSRANLSPEEVDQFILIGLWGCLRALVDHCSRISIASY